MRAPEVYELPKVPDWCGPSRDGNINNRVLHAHALEYMRATELATELVEPIRAIGLSADEDLGVSGKFYGREIKVIAGHSGGFDKREGHT